MNFEDLLEDLEYAVEAISVSDYKAAAKAAKTASRAAAKAMKAGNYDEAITKCDEAIANINAVKAEITSDRRGEEGEDGEGGSNKGPVVKAIVISVLAALAAGAAVVATKKFGGKAIAKVDAADRARTGKTLKKYNDELAKVPKNMYIDKNDDEVITSNKVQQVVKDNHANSDARVRLGVKKADVVDERMDRMKKYDKASKAAAGIGKKHIAAAAGAGAVGAGVIQALKAFVASKKYSPEAMVKALDMSIKSLEGIKASCMEAKRGRASESVLGFYEGVTEALFETGNESVIIDFLEAGMDDLTACEMYVNFVIPAVEAYENMDEYDEYYDEDDYEDYE